MGCSRNVRMLIVVLLGSALVLTGCQPAPGPQAPPPEAKAAAPSVDAPILASLSGAERERVAGLIQAARKEGELSWIDAVVVPDSAVKLGEAFKQRYGLPDLKVSHQRLQTAQVTARVQEEVKAGRVTIDVFAVASPRLFYGLKEVGALAQYESPEYAKYESAKRAGITWEQGYWMSHNAYTFAPVTNPKFYPKDITSWNDLLDPALKGKFDFPDGGSGEAGLYHYIGLRKVMGRDYFEKIAALQPMIGQGSSVEQTQKLASGEQIVAVTPPFRLVQTIQRTGVLMKAFFPKEGTTMLGHPYGILAQAPHPNAARLFIDFLYSEEGQKLYVDLEGVISARDGLPSPEHVRPISPPLAEIKSIPLDWKALDEKAMDAARAEWRDIFKR